MATPKELYARARKLPPWKQVLLALLIVAVIVALIEVVLYSTVWVRSVQSGLTLYVEHADDVIQARTGDTAEITYTIAARNAPFCHASCTYQVIEHKDNKIVASGQVDRLTRTHHEITASVPTPDKGSWEIPVQLIVTCANEDTLRCQRTEDNTTESSVVLLDVERTERQQALLEEAEQAELEFREQAQNDFGTLLGIRLVQDPRAVSIASRAREELEILDGRIESVREAMEQDEFELALNLMKEHYENSAVNSYARLVEDAERAATIYADVKAKEADLQEALRVASIARAATLKTARDDLAALATEWEDTAPSEARSRAELAHDVITKALTAVNSTDRPALTAALAQHQGAEKARCTLYSTTCSNNSDLNTACMLVATYEERVRKDKEAYAKTLYPNQTLAQAMTTSGSDALSQDPAWPAREADIIHAASEAILIANSTERLATNLTINQTTMQTIQDRCGRPPLAPLPRTPPRTLVKEVQESVTIRAATPTSTKTCGAIGCEGDSTLPVVFLHGHSFSDNAAPEYSLRAFTPMAFALQEDGILYAGPIFPNEQRNAGSLAAIPGGVSFTTTYYYDSFAEEGSMLLVPRNSERIETYALRLSESLTAVKQVTGNDQVILVTHSMGGLVARRYLQLFGDEDVAGLVMIGTPNKGISRLTERLCPVVGSDLECDDMKQGSVFIAKLNAQPPPDVPVLVIAGVGCDGRAYDGVVERDSVVGGFEDLLVINGTCPDNNRLLHNRMLRPDEHPKVLNEVRSFILENTQ